MTQTISLPLAAIVMASSLGEGQFVFHRESVLGTSLELKVVADTYVNAQTAEARVLAKIERESKILSGYDAGSEFSCWVKTRDEAVAVSDDLFEVLSRFDRYRALTGGADLRQQHATRNGDDGQGGRPRCHAGHVQAL